MRGGELTYDGTTYRLDPEAVADLVGRGVIAPDPVHSGEFELSREHVIAEIEARASSGEFLSGESARGESREQGRRRLFAARFLHRDGQGGGGH